MISQGRVAVVAQMEPIIALQVLFVLVAMAFLTAWRGPRHLRGSDEAKRLC